MKYLILLALLAACSSTQKTSQKAAVPKLSIEQEDCLKGWPNMGVKVQVGKEDFSFSPSCPFHFSESFTTKDGRSCQLESPMCGAFIKSASISLKCDDGFSDSLSFECAAY